MPHVSFARDIRPLFRAVDISHMKRYARNLGDFTFMSNPDHANKVLRTLSPHADEPPSMPPGGPYWSRRPARVVRSVAEGRIPAVSFIMAAEEIPVSAYASRLLNRVEVAEGTIAFQFEKPPGFDFKPGQSADLTLLNPPETDSEGNVRTFSIASAPFEDQLGWRSHASDGI